jgi:hypothetical protein
MTLLILLSGLALLAPAQSTLEPRVGAERTIIPAKERLTAGLYTWPDGPIGIVPSGSERVFYAPNRGDIARTTGTLDDPIRQVSTGTAVKGASALEDVGYAAGGPIYRGGGAMLMFVHLERYPSDRPQDGTYASIGLARSSDEGQTWELLGEIFSQNLTYDRYRDEPGRCGTDAGGKQFGVANTSFGQYVVRREEGSDYFYIYGADTQAPPAEESVPCEVNLAVARAPVDEVVSAALEGEVSQWRKYHEGGWEEPGLGGRSTNIWPGPRRLSFDVSYNRHLDRYILAMVRPISQSRFVLDLAASADGITWSPPQPAFASEGEIYAPTIVGLEADPRVSGQSFRVYYVNSLRGLELGSRWVDAALRSRLIEFP